MWESIKLDVGYMVVCEQREWVTWIISICFHLKYWPDHLRALKEWDQETAELRAGWDSDR